jgi:hypothetical protein
VAAEEVEGEEPRDLRLLLAAACGGHWEQRNRG